VLKASTVRFSEARIGQSRCRYYSVNVVREAKIDLNALRDPRKFLGERQTLEQRRLILTSVSWRRREVHMRPMVRLLLFCLLLVCTRLLLAQERHLASDSAGTLYARSAFAHGYIHGYEEGFHNGDLDLQLGRDPRDPVASTSYKHAVAAYRRNFGSKPLFKAGFEDGFLAGYSDAFQGLAFRAVGSLRKAAEGLEPPRASGRYV
jgi:hypothetical protein